MRSSGLNGASAALVGDAGSVFGNPAGLATIRHIALEGAFRREPGGRRATTAAGAWRLRQFDLGGGIQSVLGGAGPDERLITGSAIYRFGLIAAGASAKWIGSRQGGVTSRAWGADWGMAIAIFDIMAIGFSMQNVGGNQVDGSTVVLPRLTRLGFTMNYVDPQESFRLLSSLEVQWPESRRSRFVAGGEAGTVIKGVGVVGRLAYGSPWPGYHPSSMTYGGSVVLGRLIADYAYEPSLLSVSRHRLGLRLTF